MTFIDPRATELPAATDQFNCHLCWLLKPTPEFLVRRAFRISRLSKACYCCRCLKGQELKVARRKARAKPPALERWQYREYMTSERWERTRTQISKRCAVCQQSHFRLHAHHLHYETLGFERPRDLKGLCPVCHAAVHVISGKADKYPIRDTRQRLKRLLKSVPIDWADIRLRFPKEYAFVVARHFQVCNHVFVKALISGAKLDRVRTFLIAS